MENPEVDEIIKSLVSRLPEKDRVQASLILLRFHTLNKDDDILGLLQLLSIYNTNFHQDVIKTNTLAELLLKCARDLAEIPRASAPEQTPNLRQVLKDESSSPYSAQEKEQNLRDRRTQLAIEEGFRKLFWFFFLVGGGSLSIGLLIGLSADHFFGLIWK